MTNKVFYDREDLLDMLKREQEISDAYLVDSHTEIERLLFQSGKISVDEIKSYLDELPTYSYDEAKVNQKIIKLLSHLL